MGRTPNPDRAPVSTNRGIKVKPTQHEKVAPAGATPTGKMPEGSLRQTPYERLRARLAGEGTPSTRVTRVEDLLTMLRSPDGLQQKITLRMKLLWVSEHSYKQFKLTKLHFIDAESPEPLEDLLALFRDKYEEHQDDIDATLLTATIWDVGSESNGLPRSGQVVDINSYSGLKLFCEERCQVTVKLRDLSFEHNNP